MSVMLEVFMVLVVVVLKIFLLIRVAAIPMLAVVL